MQEFLLSSFIILGALLSVIALHSAWLLAKSRKTVVTWIYPIVVALAIMLGAKGVVDIQGYPVNGKPTGEWEYLTHAEEGASVLVIVVEDNEARTYRFVPTQKEKEKMQEGGQAKDKGQRPMMTFDGDIPQMRLVRLDEEHPK